jgi:murein DD-endopeptidase MepM/ murein hydrolase activator NlpD
LGRRSPLVPSAAAAALIVAAAGGAAAVDAGLTGGGADEAVPASTVLALSPEQRLALRAEEAAAQVQLGDLATRRQAAAVQASAAHGRAEATQRAARAAKRKAAEAAAARAAKKKAAAKAARAARAKAAAAAAARAKAHREGKRWVRAIRGASITSGFGPRWGRNHDGLDFGASTGTPLYAMSKGTVVLARYAGGLGNKVEIRYWDGTVSWYGHLSRISVRAGQSVMPGQLVGRVGNTGNSFGSHLHLEIHPSGGDNPVDPYPWLVRKGLLG